MARKVVTLCGSFRFWDSMQQTAERLALEQGWVVLSPTPHVLDRPLAAADIALLGELHRARIAMADAVYIVNVDGYIGEAVRAEIAYASALGKEILYLEEP